MHTHPKVRTPGRKIESTQGVSKNSHFIQVRIFDDVVLGFAIRDIRPTLGDWGVAWAVLVRPGDGFVGLVHQSAKIL